MRLLPLLAMGGLLLLAPTQSRAETGGCLKYGAAGAVAGHAVGHAFKGAAAGCVAGMVVRRQARRAARASAAAQSPRTMNPAANSLDRSAGPMVPATAGQSVR